MQTPPFEMNRRQFLHGVLGTAAFSTTVHAAGSDEIRVGLIGCGGRGTGAAENCIKADPAVRITALGDTFLDQVDASLKRLKGNADIQSKIEAPDYRCFAGLDAYKRVIDSGVDLVILATPPGFRPLHVTAAIEAGKHVFAEKSGAVDSTGVRTLLAAYRVANLTRLSVVAGLQRRYQPSYAETVRRIQAGAIGELRTGACYWMTNGVWEPKDRQPSWSDFEYQIRNWFYYSWLSGDTINEQHIHNLDAMNWALNSHPSKAVGLGERRKYSDPKYGNSRDHFVVTYSYPQNITVHSECGIRAEGEKTSVTETLTGAMGSCELVGKIVASNAEPWKYSGGNSDPYKVEFDVLLQSIRSGKPRNDLKILAESALTAIMGRMAADTGEEVTWEQALNSSEDLMPRNLAMGPLAVAAIPSPKGKPTPRTTGTGEKYALLVGVRNYDKNELQNLKYSEPDISGLSATLLKLGYRRENVVLMTQTRGAEDDRFLPRADNIQRELRLLLKGLSENDSVIIGFAGHGIQYRNETEAYFCPAGTKLAEKSTLVSLGDVYAELDKCPAKFKLLISDACRNDPRTSNARSSSNVDLDSVTRPQKRIPPGGIAALFSCSAGEQAFEHDDLKHGVFYHFVIKGLEGDADSDGDGVVSLPELENYVKKRVFDYVRAEYGREQMPDFVGRVKGLVPLAELKKK